MGEPKCRCVKVYGHPETQKLMDEAFKCLKDEHARPEHFSEKECFNVVKKEQNVIYMFDVFEGDAFEHIVGLGCRAYGPMCILTCVSCNEGVPRDGSSVYNLAMKDVKVCCTNLDAEKRKFIYGKVEWMGGTISKEFTQDVTHLVAGSVGSKKYQAAAGYDVQIMTPKWVEDVWEKSKLEAVHCKDEQFQVHRCPLFLGCVVTVSGLSSEERKEVKRLIEKEGGRYSGEMTMKESTHLIINEPKGQKYLFALKWNILVVKSEWLYESIEKGYCQDEAEYKLDASNQQNKGQMKTSTPERKSLAANAMSDISNISMISMMNVNETKFNSTVMSTNMTQLYDHDPVEILDITRPTAELFLDGCKIYLSGFRGPALEKLRKVINMGGGTRFNQITDNLTHIIIGERIEKDIEQIKALSIRPQVVTSQWICDCFKQETMLDSYNYISGEIPVDPTTPKKKGIKKPTKVVEDNQQPSTSKQDVTSNPDPGDDMDDIMSQYLTKPQDPDESKQSNDTTLAPADVPADKTVDPEPQALDAADMTQDPNEGTAQDEEGGVFHRKTFILLGFEDEILPEFSSLVNEQGGVVLQFNSRKIPDFAVVPVNGFPVDRTVGDIVTNVWLETCLEQGCLLDCHSNPLFSPIEIQVGPNPLKDCVLSTSGYAGIERRVILNIAEVLGATNQDCFLRVAKNGMLANTQLIVNAPTGSKYQAAKKWGIPAVSKRWLLACAKSGQLESIENFLIENESETSNCGADSSSKSNKQVNPTSETVGASKTQDNAEKGNAALDVNDLSEKAAQLNRSHSAPQNKRSSIDRTKGDVTQDIKDADRGKCIESNNTDKTSVVNNQDTSKVTGADFSSTGDTEAFLLGLNTQGEQNNTNNEITIQQEKPDDLTDRDTNVDQDANDKSIGVKPQSVQNDAQVHSVNERSEVIMQNKDMSYISDKEDVKEPVRHPAVLCLEDNDVESTESPRGTRDRLLKKWDAELRNMEPEKDLLKQRSSQKENIGTPLQNRVKELKSQQVGGVLDKDTPSKFLNPNVKYIPKFDVKDMMKAFDTPEDVRAARARRRSSLPFDELLEMKMAEAEQKRLKMKDGKQQDPGILHGVIISVAKKLAKNQSDLNELVRSLGGDCRWNYDNSCTHFIFQGRQNDTAKDFKVAKSNGCTIVHPNWVYICKEQNRRVDEAMYPHTFNPNLSLSVVSTKRTPCRTPARSTRRNMRDRFGSKTDDSQVKNDPIVIPDDLQLHSKEKPSTPKESHPVRTSPKESPPIRTSPIQSRKHSPTVVNLRQSKGNIKSPDKSSSDEDKKTEDSGSIQEEAPGGSLEMREMLSRQLENVMAESKGKKRRRSKRLNCSGGQVATPEDPASSKSVQRTQENASRNSSRTSKSIVEPVTKEEEKSSLEMAPSQSVQIVWDDPMGRMEQEKLAHKLERACSPTQDTNAFYGADPEGAQYSESEGESDIPVPVFEQQNEDRTTPRSEKVTTNKTPTPEGPSIAFPTNSKMDRITPPKPVLTVESEEKIERLPPVFMLSGLNPAERDDYGVLVEKLGGKVIDCQQFDPKCSHLVVGGISRNEKILGSIAAGKWILHKSYFEACRLENKFVEEDLYELGSQGTLPLVKNLDTNVRLLAMAARDWRIKVQEERKKSSDKYGAFYDWCVILCCDKHREGNYKRLLEAGGATVLNQKPPFTEKVNATHVLVDLNKVTLSQEDLETLLNSGCLCLKPEIICAHLSDSTVNFQNYMPPEVIALQTVLSDSNENTRKKRKASSGEISVKRSKRR